MLYFFIDRLPSETVEYGYLYEYIVVYLEISIQKSSTYLAFNTLIYLLAFELNYLVRIVGKSDTEKYINRSPFLNREIYLLKYWPIFTAENCHRARSLNLLKI